MSADATAAGSGGAPGGAPGGAADPAAALDAGRRAAFAAVAGLLIPEAHGMPSAADVVGEARLRFVLGARPDLAAPLAVALRPELGTEPGTRLAALERDEPVSHGALISTVVFGYYTDARVRELLGYPGQVAKTLYSWKVPDFIEEGLTDAVLARGPVWRDPATGVRAVIADATPGPSGPGPAATTAPTAGTEERP